MVKAPKHRVPEQEENKVMSFWKYILVPASLSPDPIAMLLMSVSAFNILHHVSRIE